MNDDLIYLGDILDRIERIESYTQEGKDRLFAVLKSLEKLLNNSLLRLEKNILKLLGVKLQGFEIF